MSFSFHSDEKKIWVVLCDEPEYCHVLEEAPTTMEPELREGLWLVIVFAVWSTPDRYAVGSAINVTKRFRGNVQLGIRPFMEYPETPVWCTEAVLQYASPIWLILQNGKLVSQLAHPTEDKLVELLKCQIENPDECANQ